MADNVLPEFRKDIDDAFTHTWWEMRQKAVDNILDANVVSAALKDAGCFKPQTGGLFIQRNIRYGKKQAIDAAKGDTLPTGETQLETAALWTWRYFTVHVQRSLQDDQKNSGPAKIKDLVKDKLQAARDALNEHLEAALLAPVDYTNGGKEGRSEKSPYSLQNILDVAHQGQGVGQYTFGGIDRNNSWWRVKSESATDPAMLNLIPQMNKLFNNITKGSSERPDLIIMDQMLFQTYQELVEADIQRVAETNTHLADLGYDVLRFRGARVVWTGHASFPQGKAFMLYTPSIEIVYDPNLWFSMTQWVQLPNQLDRIARIVSATTGTICTQLRRQGVLGTYTK